MSGILGGERLMLMEAGGGDGDGGGNGHGNPPPLVLPSSGYRITARTRQVFLDGEFAGVTAVLRANAPIGEFLALTDLAGNIGEENVSRAFGEVVNRLPRLIVSWNLQDADGLAIPVTPEAIRDNVPMDLLMALMGKMGDGQTAPKGS